MSVKRLLSFSSGELDPILHDLVTLERFNKGLATARNTMVGKTGSLMSRFGRAHFIKAKNDNEKIKIYSPPGFDILVEFGGNSTDGGYVRFYDFDGNLLGAVDPTVSPTLFTNDNYFNSLKFETSGDFLYVFSTSTPAKYDLTNYTAVAVATAFEVPDTPNVSQTITPAGAPSGYRVDYAVTYVYNGEEYNLLDLTSLGSFNLPSASGQSNTLAIKLTNTGTEVSVPDAANEIRIYRRPNGGGAFGFVGSSSSFRITTGDLFCDFIDVGSLADFTNNPPTLITKNQLQGLESWLLGAKVGLKYQQRLLLANFTNDSEGIIASRPGFENNFQRDYPYDADSALLFKAGTSGRADVLRMIDSDGLVVFTGAGVYLGTGLLSINNIALQRKGPWVIDETIPPLVVPGGVFFVDKNTNAIRQFVYNSNIETYESSEQSIFSNHFFENKTVKSWAYQDGVTPMIIVVFSDGTFATFTYNAEQQMRAWTRHDSKYPIEEVCGTGTPDSTFFVVNKDGNRYIEVSLPRKIPADVFVTNPEADKLALNYMMDSIVTTSNLLNDSLAGSDIFELTPVTPSDWEGNLTLTCGTSALFPIGGLGDVGTVFKHFNTSDKSEVELTVVSRTDDNTVVVEPSCEFPSDQASDFRLYEALDTVTGLTHLEGESISIIVDGAVVASPYNDDDNFPTVTVSSGSITLPNSLKGAIIIVGRPIVADIKTLNINTVEQSPTIIESLTVDKLYIKVNNTRGLFISNDFPEEKDGEKDGTSVAGMENLDLFFVPDGYDIIGNRPKQPVTKRIEKTLPGSWKSQGQVSIRQVDPLAFEILSIIPDVEVLNRSNK